MYCDEDVYRLMNKSKDCKSVIYARVSSTCQKKDLENQIETLRTFCNKNGVVVSDEYADVCSGRSLPHFRQNSHQRRRERSVQHSQEISKSKLNRCRNIERVYGSGDSPGQSSHQRTQSQKEAVK